MLLVTYNHVPQFVVRGLNNWSHGSFGRISVGSGLIVCGWTNVRSGSASGLQQKLIKDVEMATNQKTEATDEERLHTRSTSLSQNRGDGLGIGLRIQVTVIFISMDKMFSFISCYTMK